MANQRPESSRALTPQVLLAGRAAAAEAILARHDDAEMLLEEAADGILIAGPDGRYRAANAVACAMLGYARAELIGLDAKTLIAPEDLAQRPLQLDVMRAGATVRIDRLFRRKDGSRLMVELTGKMLPDGRFEVIFRDITERKEVEARLRASEQRYRSLVLATAQIVWTADRDGAVVDDRPTWRAFTGQSAEEVLGDGWLAALHPDDVARIAGDWAHTVATRRVSEQAYRMRRRDGLYRNIVGRAVPVVDDGGEVVEWIGTCTDVTDRLQAEAELKRTESELRLITDMVPALIAFVDAQGRYRFVNGGYEEWFARPRAEIQGLTVAELLGAESYERVRSAVETALSGHAVSFERLLPTPGAGERYVRVEYMPRFGEDGAYEGFVALVVDMTERRRAEQALQRSEDQLRQSQKMDAIGRLAGGIAHDFNNLLTAINGYSELLMLSLESDHPGQAQAEEIRRAGERAASLTRQLLAFSRKQVLAPRTLELNAVVSDMERLLRRLIPENIELQTSLAAERSEVRADAGQIEQVLLNLVINARDASLDGGCIRIETVELDWSGSDEHTYLVAPAGRYVCLAVRDEGRGVQASARPHLFEPFFSTKDNGKGTGLGLSMVYGIVQQSRGGIRVVSQPDHGAAFEIYLPCVAVSERAGQRPPSGPQDLVRGREAVLLVEDETSVRSLVAQILRGVGFQVVEAGSGQAAIELFQQADARFDVLVTDVVMPGLGGRELAERLRQLQPALPVLFISGYTDDEHLRRSLHEAGAAFLGKPFSPRVLAQRVRELLDASAAGSAPAAS